MWKIHFTEKAFKQFSKLNPKIQQEISRYLDRICEGNPTRFGKMLVGDRAGFWRYRVGKYRIICELRNQVMVIEVLVVDKRDSVYK